MNGGRDRVRMINFQINVQNAKVTPGIENQKRISDMKRQHPDNPELF